MSDELKDRFFSSYEGVFNSCFSEMLMEEKKLLIDHCKNNSTGLYQYINSDKMIFGIKSAFSKGSVQQIEGEKYIRKILDNLSNGNNNANKQIKAFLSNNQVEIVIQPKTELNAFVKYNEENKKLLIGVTAGCFTNEVSNEANIAITLGHEITHSMIHSSQKGNEKIGNSEECENLCDAVGLRAAEGAGYDISTKQQFNKKMHYMVNSFRSKLRKNNIGNNDVLEMLDMMIANDVHPTLEHGNKTIALIPKDPNKQYMLGNVPQNLSSIMRKENWNFSDNINLYHVSRHADDKLPSFLEGINPLVSNPVGGQSSGFFLWTKKERAENWIENLATERDAAWAKEKFGLDDFKLKDGKGLIVGFTIPKTNILYPDWQVDPEQHPRGIDKYSSLIKIWQKHRDIFIDKGHNLSIPFRHNNEDVTLNTLSWSIDDNLPIIYYTDSKGNTKKELVGTNKAEESGRTEVICSFLAKHSSKYINDYNKILHEAVNEAGQGGINLKYCGREKLHPSTIFLVQKTEDNKIIQTPIYDINKKNNCQNLPSCLSEASINAIKAKDEKKIVNQQILSKAREKVINKSHKSDVAYTNTSLDNQKSKSKIFENIKTENTIYNAKTKLIK